METTTGLFVCRLGSSLESRYQKENLVVGYNLIVLVFSRLEEASAALSVAGLLFGGFRKQREHRIFLVDTADSGSTALYC